MKWLAIFLCVSHVAGCAGQGAVDEIRREVVDCQHRLNAIEHELRLQSGYRRADLQPDYDLRRGSQVSRMGE